MWFSGLRGAMGKTLASVLNPSLFDRYRDKFQVPWRRSGRYAALSDNILHRPDGNPPTCEHTKHWKTKWWAHLLDFWIRRNALDRDRLPWPEPIRKGREESSRTFGHQHECDQRLKILQGISGGQNEALTDKVQRKFHEEAPDLPAKKWQKIEGSR